MARAALYLALALAALHLGAAAIAAAATVGPLPEHLASLDHRALAGLTGRFEPAFAPGLVAALGPNGAVYPLLAALAVLGALVGRWRTVPLVGVALALSLGIAAELTWLLGRTVQHVPPIVAQPGLPVPAEWRLSWQDASAFPSRHALVTAALGAAAARAWPPLALAGYPVALVAALVPVYFGAASATDALAGVVLGCLVCEASRYAARQLLRLASLTAARVPEWFGRTPRVPVASPGTGVLRSLSRAS